MLQTQKYLTLLCLLVLLSFPVTVFSQSSSTNYKIEETFFGTGGEVDATSSSYRSQQSAGSLGVGNTSSANYDSVAGFITPNVPYLEIAILGPNVDFGTLDPATTSYVASQGGTCNCTFYVRTYLSSQYTVITASNPPTNESGNIFQGKATTGAPSGSTAVEEFGINLRDNTPTTSNIGVDPINVRQEGASEVQDNSFADGQAYGDGAGGNRDYDDVDQFAYGAGDIIARSQATVGNQAVGKTNYTITYMMKPSNISRAGLYIMRHDIVAVPTY